MFFDDKEHKLETLDKVREFFKSQIGSRTRQALEELSIPFAADDLDRVLIQVEDMVQQKFPGNSKRCRTYRQS